MNLSKEQLTQLEQLANVFFSITECATIMEISTAELNIAVNEPNSPEHKAYYKGFFQGQYEVRKSIKEMAERGSNPAQTLIQELINQAHRENIKRQS